MKNNKNKIWLICACAMVLGLILGIIGFVCGGARAVNVNQSGIHISSGALQTIKDLNLNAFQSIDLDTKDFNIEFVQSEHYGIEISYYNDDHQPTYSVENGTLKASDGEQNQFYNLNFGFFWHPNTMKIYLPKNVSLKDVTIKNASGSINIADFSAQTTNIGLSSGNLTMHDAASNTLTITLSSGNITLENVNSETAENTKIESQSGWINIKNLSSKTLAVSAKSGNIDLKGITTSQFSSDSKSGNTTIQNSKIGNSNLESQSGNLIATDITTDSLTAKCSSGYVKFNGALGGKTDLQASSGNVDFSTSIAEDQYSYGLTARSGNIRVNGDGDADHTKLNNGAANELTINTKSGNINADFQK